MQNYYDIPNNYNYQAAQAINNYQSPTKFYDPYQGFIRGNLTINNYDPYKLTHPFEIAPINDQAKMLTSIDALCFAMIDLNLFLDVNPTDKEAIELFNQYRIQHQQIVTNYESMYGPLTLDSNTLNTFPWIWNERPWPWEK